ncbi:BON domain-containing protein [Kibdelosporangium aridum]|uniref:BON domain-containing protein n=1 Tax=Kibdelosporangium aridum TaxID=2030 RepID=A0A1W2FW59_KIBAR|nr:BON domain-containing protein [Kibdelosporangium aridum]SMD26131.1 BON domain-containing protein [Kibdelosporangium aridum]
MPRFPRWWFWAAVVIPAVITAVGLVVQTPGIERTVEAEARKATTQGDLVVDGRDVTISGIPVEQAARVEHEVEAATGVRDVSVVDPELAPMRFSFIANEITVTGSTEQQAWRDQFVRAMSKQTHGRTLIDETKTQRGTDFPITTKAAEAVVALLSQQPETMTVDVKPGRVTVAGVIADEDRRKAIVAVFKRLFGDKTVIDQTKTKE